MLIFPPFERTEPSPNERYCASSSPRGVKGVVPSRPHIHTPKLRDPAYRPFLEAVPQEGLSMEGKKQHVDMYRKLLLRKTLMAEALPGPIYVPFIGDGDISKELYADRDIYGADIDPQRVSAARKNLPRATIIEADCNAWPFPDQAYTVFAAADFDAYSYPYDSFRSFWEGARKADRFVAFFTDAEKMPISRRGTFHHPDGHKDTVEALVDRRKITNFYLTNTLLPWIKEYVRPYKVVKEMHYQRAFMTYWGVVLDRSPDAQELGPSAPKGGRGPIKFNAEVRARYLDELRNGLRPSLAIRNVGISSPTLYDYRHKHPEFLEEERAAEAEAIDRIENSLYTAALSGNVKAMETFLFNRAPERWTDRRAPAIVNHVEAQQEVTNIVDVKRRAIARRILADPEASRLASDLAGRIGDLAGDDPDRMG